MNHTQTSLPRKCTKSGLLFLNTPPALQIAADLDAREQALLSEGGIDSEDYLRYIAEGSSNVADDGMFSVQARFRLIP